ncbi:hypothetical protein [Aeromonas caviae]|uniref:hypothetical protein n=1 Tax=Aeromonas caviae TaxID=648 RepID=UPI002AB5DD2D|nr:hypothetical protein [Aeromonas caviae]MDY7766839.1 hypothetical protein [Aeromonas caviae]
MFNIQIQNISEDKKISVITITEITPPLKKYIDKNIVSICEGATDSEIDDIKHQYLNFLSTKNTTTKHGSVAEFFVHLYLRSEGYRQEFMFFNLEEGSIKKGFDGVFTKNNQEFIVESKSGLSSTQKISHSLKLREAYNDIRDYVSGKTTKGNNNPWRNAYNHASQIDINTKKSVREKFKQLSRLYEKKEFKDISEFNIIPCSTIFILNKKSDSSSSYHDNLTNTLDSFSANSIHAVSITQNTFNQFISYLES